MGIEKKGLKIKAIKMRRNGKTYSEILSVVPVAKSTLSLWFHGVQLAKHQKQKITQKRIENQKKGARAKKAQRIVLSEKIINDSKKEIGVLSDREKWLIGTALYWAEGAKEKEYRPGSRASFSNMDEEMIRTFIKWLKICGIRSEEIIFDIYIHESKKSEIRKVINHWAYVTGFPQSRFKNIYYKKNNTNTLRRNIGKDYFGVLRICLKQSSHFLRKIKGWTEGIYEGINRC